MLANELFDAIGVENQIARTAGGIVLGASLEAGLQAIGIIDKALTWESFGLNILNAAAAAAGSFLGSELADALFDGNPIGAAIGGSIGGFAGGLVGGTILAEALIGTFAWAAGPVR